MTSYDALKKSERIKIDINAPHYAQVYLLDGKSGVLCWFYVDGEYMHPVSFDQIHRTDWKPYVEECECVWCGQAKELAYIDAVTTRAFKAILKELCRRDHND